MLYILKELRKYTQEDKELSFLLLENLKDHMVTYHYITTQANRKHG